MDSIIQRKLFIAGFIAGIMAAVLLPDGNKHSGMVCAQVPDAQNQDRITEPDRAIKQGLALIQSGSTVEGTDLFYRGLRLLGSHPYADSLFQAMKDLFTAEEEDACRRSYNKGSFILEYWQKHDPTPATPENEGIAEHWNRLREARRQFRSPVPRGYDDRGMIYVRYGPPNDRAILTSNSYGVPNECWVYNSFGEEVVFDFVKLGGHFEQLNSLRDIVADCDEEETMRKLELFVEDRRGHSSLYGSAGNISNYSDAERYFVGRIKAAAYRLPVSISQLERTAPSLQSHMSLSRFIRKDLTRTEMYIAVPYREMKSMENDPENPKNPRVPLRIAYAIRDTLGRVQYQYDYPGLIPAPRKKDDIFRFQLDSQIPEGEYGLAIELQNPPSGKSSEFLFNLAGLPVSTGNLCLSDVQITDVIQQVDWNSPQASAAKGDLQLNPIPFDEIESRQKIYCYGEIYYLSPDSGGRPEARVSYRILKQNRKDVVREGEDISNVKESFITSFRRAAGKVDCQYYFPLKIRDLKPGTYTLEIIVTDVVAGGEAHTHSLLKVVK